MAIKPNSSQHSEVFVFIKYLQDALLAILINLEEFAIFVSCQSQFLGTFLELLGGISGGNTNRKNADAAFEQRYMP